MVSHVEELVASGRSVVLGGPMGVGKSALAAAVAKQHAGATYRSPGATVATRELGVAIAEGALLVIDDIGALDPDVEAMVRSAVVGNLVTLIATARTGDPMPEGIRRLWVDDRLLHVDLAPLSRQETDDLLDQALGRPIESRTRQRLWAMSQGLPLYLRELTRTALDNGALRRLDGVWCLDDDVSSPRLDDLVLDRFHALGDDAATVVSLTALGEPLPLGPVSTAVGTDALVAAEQAGMVVVVTNGKRQMLEMAHPLHGDVVRRRIPKTRNLQLHRMLTEILATTPMRRRDDALQMSTWQIRGGGDVVDDLMLQGARRALYDQQDWLAIELAARFEDDDDPEARLVLAEALCAVGDFEQADGVLATAEVADGAAHQATVAMAAVQRSVALYWGLGRPVEAEHVLVDAQARVGPGPWFDELQAELANQAATTGDIPRAAALSESLLDTGEPRVFATAAIAASIAWTMTGRGESAAQLSERAFTAKLSVADQPGMTDSAIHIVATCLGLQEAGSLVMAEDVARLGLAEATAVTSIAGQGWFSLMLGRALLARGLLVEAGDRFAEAAASFQRVQVPAPRRWSLAGVALVAAMRGEPASSSRALRELEAAPDHPARVMDVDVNRATAWGHAARGEVDVAIRLLGDAVSEACAAGNPSLAGGAAHDIVRLGGTFTDPTLIDRMSSFEGPLGSLRSTLFQAVIDGDAAVLEQCASEFSEIGSPLWSGEVFGATARLHEAAGREADATRCRAKMASVLVGLDKARPLTIRDGADRQALTKREREVAALAAEGASNQAIADQLVISVRTVENHLQRCYSKLGVRSRTELADLHEL
ncbi:MAG: LuxR family transcriptional regulator [Acidimicrobiales bacterium]|nr:MAG: LuxR family transcriptional regulator [Acidimicrobiales bacterium]